jgi:phytoene synthase
MNVPRDIIEASYVSCRRISRRAGSSFHAGFLLLPREKRRAMDALYAFMRHTDDLADNLQIACPRRESLVAWRASLEQALIGIFKPLAASKGHALLPALADAVKRFHIPHEHLTAVIDGVEMDLGRRRYETFDDLRLYCQRVASAVGLACIYVWGFRGPEAFEPARQAGVALQLTNILRDLKEDAASDRVYLPLEDLRQCGYSMDDLLAGVINEPFFRLMRMEIERTKQHYRAANELMDWLLPDGRRIFGMMMSTYRALLTRIEHRPADVMRRHICLGTFAKLKMLARWTLFPPRVGRSE